MKSFIFSRTDRLTWCLGVLLGLSVTAVVFAQGTAITYQGRLYDGVNPANGGYDLVFTVFDSLNNPGGVIAGPLTNSATAVSNGLFTVTLDFGPGVFTGPSRWLEIGARTNGGGAFITLSPRQQLTPVPYAITAENVSAGGVSAGAYTNAVAFNSPANTFTGSFTGNGAGLTNVNAGSLGGLGASNFWQTSGNLNTTPGLNFLGTADNRPLELDVNGQCAFRLEPDTNGAPNVIGGSSNNVVALGAVGAFIGGGGATAYSGTAYTNTIESDFGVIGGGFQNTIQPNALSSFIGAGGNNTIQAGAAASSIGGGDKNVIQTNAYYSSIDGGYGTSIGTNSYFSSIGGGDLNIIQANAGWSTIAGGNQNQITAGWSTIAGGELNLVELDAPGSFIGGGYSNTIQTNAQYSSISGGYNNIILTNAGWSTIAGGSQNQIAAGGSTIAGGEFNLIQSGSLSAFIGGGVNNTIQTNAYSSSIDGGQNNTIQSGAHFSSISGGYNNAIQTNAYDSTISGGYGSGIGTNSYFSSIGGGYSNTILANAGWSTISGGNQNQITAGWSTIAGGQFNLVELDAPGSFIGGGVNNIVETNAQYSSIGGGANNTIQTNAQFSSIGGGNANTNGGPYATVPGGAQNYAAGNFSFAAGNRAKALHLGAFAWADSQSADFASTTANQFNVRASGGVRFVTGGAGMTLDGQPVLAGTVVSSQLAGTYSGAVTFNNAADSFTGLFTGNGGGLTNVNALTLDGLGTNNFWQTTGNRGTVAGPNFIGTTDNQPLEMHAWGQRALRLEPNTNGAPNMIGGSAYNLVDLGVVGATIGGGGATNYFGTAYTNRVSSDFDTIGGGTGNLIQNTSLYSVISGGAYNTIQVNCSASAIAGGYGNSIQGIDAFESTIGGGYQNTMQPGASTSFIGGGQWNTNGAPFSVVPGGFKNYAKGQYSLAAGQQAQALYQGDFVWADSQNATFVSTANDQFLIRAQGGVGINTNNPNGAALSINGPLSANGPVSINGGVLRLNDNHIFFRGGTDQFHGLGWYSSGTFSNNPDGPVLFGCGGGALGVGCGTPSLSLLWTPSGVTVNGTFNNNSDRNAKEQFSAISSRDVLDKVTTLPISRWSYKTDATTRHIGPMAQDFYSAFHVGTDDKHIAPIDEGGVALAAIQGLNQKLEQELRQKDAQIEALNRRVDELALLLGRLNTAAKGRTAPVSSY